MAGAGAAAPAPEPARSDPVAVWADPDAVTRVLVNLVDNAARFARSEVRLGVAVDGDRVRVLVDDDGPGIAPGERERVFERFTRLDTARSRADGGSGLGLAIVRELVRVLRWRGPPDRSAGGRRKPRRHPGGGQLAGRPSVTSLTTGRFGEPRPSLARWTLR